MGNTPLHQPNPFLHYDNYISWKKSHSSPASQSVPSTSGEPFQTEPLPTMRARSNSEPNTGPPRDPFSLKTRLPPLPPRGPRSENSKSNRNGSKSTSKRGYNAQRTVNSKRKNIPPANYANKSKSKSPISLSGDTLTNQNTGLRPAPVSPSGIQKSIKSRSSPKTNVKKAIPIHLNLSSTATLTILPSIGQPVQSYFTALDIPDPDTTRAKQTWIVNISRKLKFYEYYIDNPNVALEHAVNLGHPSKFYDIFLSDLVKEFDLLFPSNNGSKRNLQLPDVRENDDVSTSRPLRTRPKSAKSITSKFAFDDIDDGINTFKDGVESDSGTNLNILAPKKPKPKSKQKLNSKGVQPPILTSKPKPVNKLKKVTNSKTVSVQNSEIEVSGNSTSVPVADNSTIPRSRTRKYVSKATNQPRGPGKVPLSKSKTTAKNKPRGRLRTVRFNSKPQTGTTRPLPVPPLTTGTTGNGNVDIVSNESVGRGKSRIRTKTVQRSITRSLPRTRKSTSKIHIADANPTPSYSSVKQPGPISVSGSLPLSSPNINSGIGFKIKLLFTDLEMAERLIAPKVTVPLVSLANRMLSSNSYGLVHSAIQLGPYILSYNNSSLIIPQEATNKHALLSFDVETITSRDRLLSVLSSFSALITQWNRLNTYSPTNTNCQHFVQASLLTLITVPPRLTITDGPLAILRKVGILDLPPPTGSPSNLACYLEFLTKTGKSDKLFLLQDKIHKFVNHSALDSFCRKFSSNLSTEDLFLLKAYDRAFWLRKLALPDDKTCLPHSKGCYFGNPFRTRSIWSPGRA